ncbi:Thrombospondin-1, partial [Lamellibrachia satsuma]
WSEWGEYNNCSVTCGGGVMTRSRACDTPDSCRGEALSSLPCNYNGCPVDGAWAAWTPWAVCSLSCSGGTQARRRECVGPFDGGSPCDGLAEQSQKCEEQPC